MRLALDCSRFIMGQRGPAGAQVTTVNRHGREGGSKFSGAACFPCPTRCPHVWLGFPFSVGQSGQCQDFKGARKMEGEKKQSLLLIIKEEEKTKESWSFRLLLMFKLVSQLCRGSYWHTEQSPWWQEGKMRGEKNTKTMSTKSGWLKSCKKQLWLWECADPSS